MSRGLGDVYKRQVEGDGIFVQMLKEKGIAVYSENEVTEVLKLINGGK